MKYAFLIYGDDSEWVDLPEDERAALRADEMPEWVALFEQLGKADPNVSGHELNGRRTARVVQVKDGERVVTDGQVRLVPGAKVDIKPSSPPAAQKAG